MPTIRIDTDHIAHLLATVVGKVAGLTLQMQGRAATGIPDAGATYKQAVYVMSEKATADFLAHRLPDPIPYTNENFPIRIGQGDAKIEYIHGKVTPDYFQIYVGLSGERCWVENSCEGAVTNVLVYPDGSKVWNPNTGMMVAKLVQGAVTVIELPENWQIGLSESKGVLRIIGVRYPEDTADISMDIPFTVCTPAEFGH